MENWKLILTQMSFEEFLASVEIKRQGIKI